MHEIGKIETFRVTDEVPGQPEQDAAGVSPVFERERETLAGILADVFRPDDQLPREMQEKALREGFVRLDADGLFAADRYIFPEQIDRVEGDRLVLAVRKEDLLKAWGRPGDVFSGLWLPRIVVEKQCEAARLTRRIYHAGAWPAPDR